VRDSLCPQYMDSFVYSVPPEVLQPDCLTSPVVQFQASLPSSRNGEHVEMRPSKCELCKLMYSNIAIIIITFAKEVEFSSAFVYLFVNRITQKNYSTDFTKPVVKVVM